MVCEHPEVSRKSAVYLLQTLDQAHDFAFWFALHIREPMDIWAVEVPPDVILQEDPHQDMAANYNSWMTTSPISVEGLSLVMHLPTPSSASEAPSFAQPVNWEPSGIRLG